MSDQPKPRKDLREQLEELAILLEGNPYIDPDFIPDSRALKAAVMLLKSHQQLREQLSAEQEKYKRSQEKVREYFDLLAAEREDVEKYRSNCLYWQEKVQTYEGALIKIANDPNCDRCQVAVNALSGVKEKVDDGGQRDEWFKALTTITKLEHQLAAAQLAIANHNRDNNNANGTCYRIKADTTALGAAIAAATSVKVDFLQRVVDQRTIALIELSAARQSLMDALKESNQMLVACSESAQILKRVDKSGGWQKAEKGILDLIQRNTDTLAKVKEGK